MLMTTRAVLMAASIITVAGGGAYAADETPLTLKISAVSGSVMPQDFRAGITEGIFARHGIKLEISELATGTNNITSTVNGSADIGYADIFAGLSSIKNGFDIGFVAPHNGLSPFQFILVKPDSAIKAVKDLEGKNIALGAPPQFKVIASSIVSAQGGDPSKVKFTIVPDQTSFGAVLQSDQADAIFTSSAVNAYKWIAQFGFRTVGETNTRGLKIADGSPIAGWWATAAWYEKNNDAAKRFTDALRETETWYRGLSKDKQAEYVKSQTKIDLRALDKETPGILDAATEYFGYEKPVDLDKLKAWIAVGSQYANVPGDVDLDKHIFATAKN
ncbi:ABC transporter substrate-binding protein (plasmid) [Agrobacterium fabrum]|uniref:ABC transporter substrate-binding protein n=1 Tax=Agrobacterium fabrum TaxID=1176649 RepID=UPI001573301A|nr:ABC transporter substrate-binding protein [Agrobacterium fabrum]NTB10487.1 ABC transporter substrate-binding protein [Agrobacterium fabrum]